MLALAWAFETSVAVTSINNFSTWNLEEGLAIEAFVYKNKNSKTKARDRRFRITIRVTI